MCMENVYYMKLEELADYALGGNLVLLEGCR